ncbi:hypothetical protein FPZ42_03765 [Mucilaginibacter achroorhodeus]|uniref:Lipoprotein n=1 Tax=Mucilaginibacter achroorhodeus TaxID=2599294 RepID=A0A563UAD0_9SPHI|nr:hypothetical protein [Mucilaginibacter achroorhodeus]TWR28342.1 hypothetical protein FPZ42_03765 [Mucilaginibacter achroorhodeus]
MKRFVPLIISAALFCSCDNNQQSADKPLNQGPELLQQFKPLINGTWVKKDYIKKVKKSKSPLEAVDHGVGVTVFRIDISKMKGDSIPVTAVVNNHEAANLTLRFQPGRNTTTIVFGNDELSYKLKNNDTTLIIYHYDNKTKETSSAQYIKAPDENKVGDLATAMNLMINQAILSGNYQGTDATGKPVNARFTDDGKVSGLPGLSTYFVQNDHIADPQHSHDEIMFNMNAAGQKSYSFIINKKTLYLYDDAEHIKSNKPSYTLKRKRD